MKYRTITLATRIFLRKPSTTQFLLGFEPNKYCNNNRISKKEWLKCCLIQICATDVYMGDITEMISWWRFFYAVDRTVDLTPQAKRRSA